MRQLSEKDEINRVHRGETKVRLSERTMTMVSPPALPARVAYRKGPLQSTQQDDEYSEEGTNKHLSREDVNVRVPSQAADDLTFVSIETYFSMSAAPHSVFNGAV